MKKKTAETVAQVIARFMSFVVPVPESGCWIWVGSVNEFGYGRFYLRGKNEKAHRVSYALFNGEIPEGMILMHSCDTRCCVNPSHLKPGTQQQNLQDMSKRGRMNPVSLLNLKRPDEPKYLPPVRKSGTNKRTAASVTG